MAELMKDAVSLEAAVRKAVAEVAVTDIHTHLFPPSHGKLLLWGIDELLTYHYLVAELFMVAPRSLSPREFWRLPKRRQADLVWEHVFLRQGAFSEAARGVVTTLSSLGLTPDSRNLTAIRRWFDAQRPEEYLAKVLKLANVESVVMTNNPFVAEEAECWRQAISRPGAMKAALRIDTLLFDWPSAARVMKADGYPVSAKASEKSFGVVRKFLADWAKRIRPVYMAASLPPEFEYPSRSACGAVLKKVVLPAARELGLPVAMMIGVRKAVNPELGDGGDSVGVADLLSVQHLCRENPDVKFLVTVLSPVNQHELCVLARKFRNLHVFGCWWFCNNPSLIAEITRMRLEMLGAAFTCQHSDARVLDQVVYKWAHARKIVADVLVEKYRDLLAAGWRSGEEEIRRDVRRLFGGAFTEFLAK